MAIPPKQRLHDITLGGVWVMSEHVGEWQYRGRLYQDRRAPPCRPICVTSQVRAEARRADEVLDGVPMAFRVGEVEGARYGLKTERVVAHIKRCEGNGIRTLLSRLLGG